METNTNFSWGKIQKRTCKSEANCNRARYKFTTFKKRTVWIRASQYVDYGHCYSIIFDLNKKFRPPNLLDHYIYIHGYFCIAIPSETATQITLSSLHHVAHTHCQIPHTHLANSLSLNLLTFVSYIILNKSSCIYTISKQKYSHKIGQKIDCNMYAHFRPKIHNHTKI